MGKDLKLTEGVASTLVVTCRAAGKSKDASHQWKAPGQLCSTLSFCDRLFHSIRG